MRVRSLNACLVSSCWTHLDYYACSVCPPGSSAPLSTNDNTINLKFYVFLSSIDEQCLFRLYIINTNRSTMFVAYTLMIRLTCTLNFFYRHLILNTGERKLFLCFPATVVKWEKSWRELSTPTYFRFRIQISLWIFVNYEIPFTERVYFCAGALC